MTDLIAIILFGLGVLLFPFMVFFCAKLGTYGYLRARSNFEKLNQKETDNAKART